MPKYTNMELAEICRKTPGCYKCTDLEVKRQCLKNECWKDKDPKKRKPPCVYYGLIGGKCCETDES